MLVVSNMLSAVMAAGGSAVRQLNERQRHTIIQNFDGFGRTAERDDRSDDGWPAARVSYKSHKKNIIICFHL